MKTQPNTTRRPALLLSILIAATSTTEAAVTIGSDNFDTSVAGTGNVLTLTVVQSSTVGGTYGGYGMDNLVLSGTLVPEPGSSALIALGCAGLLIRRRR